MAIWNVSLFHLRPSPFFWRFVLVFGVVVCVLFVSFLLFCVFGAFGFVSPHDVEIQ